MADPAPPLRMSASEYLASGETLEVDALYEGVFALPAD
jgi:hypothetical protein